VFDLKTEVDFLAIGIILEIIFDVDDSQFVLSVQITDHVLRN
jgi:hypothetical protein